MQGERPAEGFVGHLDREQRLVWIPQLLVPVVFLCLVR